MILHTKGKKFSESLAVKSLTAKDAKGARSLQNCEQFNPVPTALTRNLPSFVVDSIHRSIERLFTAL
jgi:hypothetical protein